MIAISNPLRSSFSHNLLAKSRNLKRANALLMQGRKLPGLSHISVAPLGEEYWSRPCYSIASHSTTQHGNQRDEGRSLDGSSLSRGVVMADTGTTNAQAEWSRHQGTIMAWPTGQTITEDLTRAGQDLISEVREEVAAIARMIARHETLHLFVNDSPEDVASCSTILASVRNMHLHRSRHVHSLWARDTGPTTVLHRDAHTSRKSAQGVVLNFNQWGRKLSPGMDTRTASTMLNSLDIAETTPRTKLCTEGGALEFDGQGTVLVTESSILNSNRNPGWTKVDVEKELRRLFGVTKAIWVAGLERHDITDWHIDAVARFVAPAAVVLQRPHRDDVRDVWNSYQNAKAVLGSAVDANGMRLHVHEVDSPCLSDTGMSSDAVASYVNFLIGNGFVLMPAFGDGPADDAARRLFGDLFPGREIEQVYIKRLPEQGGGVHCATQPIFSVG